LAAVWGKCKVFFLGGGGIQQKDAWNNTDRDTRSSGMHRPRGLHGYRIQIQSTLADDDRRRQPIMTTGRSKAAWAAAGCGSS